jgi:hypothetical protein
MEENDIIEKGINILISGEYNRAKEYFLSNYNINKTEKLLHFITISLLLSGNTDEISVILKEVGSENDYNRSINVLTLFINKNKTILLKASDYRKLIIVAVMLKKKGFINESKEYVKVGHLINPINSQSLNEKNTTAFEANALLGEILIREKKYKDGIDYLIKASMQKK